MEYIDNNKYIRMYKQWLYLFNSPIKEVNIKNKKEKQTIKKEWLDDGSMKISGNKPSEWSIILQPILSTDVYTLKHNLINDQLEAKDLFKRAFQYRNKNLFKEGEIKYTYSEKKQNEIDSLIQNNVNLLKNIQEKIFQIRRNLYLANLEKTVNSDKVKKLSSELEKVTMEQINLQKDIKEQEYNYILKTQSIIQKGPIPEPPNVKHLSLTIRRQKFQFEKDEKEINEESEESEDEDILDDIINTGNSNINSNNKKTNSETNKSGGYIKIIKLS